ncbi:hypothetical protein F7Q99_19995 [Streptomyces kaniharaensis]|uniref:Uncharacterized protein n=1 Tax=Streptomyces kaniharaensis TaxID=212423 RepID=A0A6N7KY21_9ACTN|nr:hypothetical protein [Streptomyces kaniharaensis]MQS14483.1 hypothetical protein [Streptomyces kaniharaensis]
MSHYRDPAAKPDATIASLTLTPVAEEDRERARRYVARRARDEADKALLLTALGLDQPPA